MTQSEQILAHLKAGKSITPLLALRKFDCLRLGARIWDLRQDGHPIIKQTAYDRKSKKHFASYSLLTRKRMRAA